MNSTYQQLCHNLETLKLTQMQLHLNEVADFVSANNLSFSEGLLKLTNFEADYKSESAARSMVKAGAFPHHKELKDFDFSFQPGINQQEISEYNTLRFLSENENLVFLGPSGVGKTHLATSIGITAAKKRISTYFIKCNDLLQQLKKAQSENRLSDRLKHFSKYRLLIIDELGYLPINKEDSNLFFQLIDMRYEKKSTIHHHRLHGLGVQGGGSVGNGGGQLIPEHGIAPVLTAALDGNGGVLFNNLAGDELIVGARSLGLK